MKYFFYDLETTGLHYGTDTIHRIGGCIYSNGKILERFNIKLGSYAPDLPRKQVILFKELRAVLDRHINKYDNKDKLHLAGWNIIDFDNKFLRKLFEIHNHKYFGSYFWSDSIDVMPLASNYLRNRRHTMENFKLGTVAKKLGIKVIDSRLHDAAYDAEITRQVYKKVSK